MDAISFRLNQVSIGQLGSVSRPVRVGVPVVSHLSDGLLTRVLGEVGVRVGLMTVFRLRVYLVDGGLVLELGSGSVETVTEDCQDGLNHFVYVVGKTVDVLIRNGRVFGLGFGGQKMIHVSVSATSDENDYADKGGEGTSYQVFRIGNS